MAQIDIEEDVMYIHNEPGAPSIMPAQQLRNMIRSAILENGDYPAEIHIVDPIILTGSAEGLFADIPGLYTISGLDKLGMSRVTSMKDMFKDDTHLSQLYMSEPDFDAAYGMSLCNTPCLEDVSHMFEGCSSLTSVRIVDDECSPIKNMEGMFAGCESLEHIDIKGIDTSQVTNMSQMFKGCENIRSLQLDWHDEYRAMLDVSGVRDLSEMFDGCRRLESLGARNTIWPDASTTDHRDMFRGCVSLNEVRSSPSMQSLLTAHDLTSETLAARKETMETVTHREGNVLVIGNPDATIEIDASVLANIIAKRINERKTRGLPNIHEVRIDGPISLKGDASGLFLWLEHTETIDGLGLLDTSQVTNMSNMFRCCTHLRNIDISGLDTSNVTDMSEMFDNCSRLEEISLDGIDTSQVTNMDRMFAGCYTLQSLDVSNLDVSNVESASGMFAGCLSITNLDISSWQAPNLTDMRYMFNSCENLETLTTDGMSSDTGGFAKRVEGMFGFCEKLASLDLSGFGITEDDLNPSMFYSCISLKDVEVLVEDEPTHGAINRTPIPDGMSEVVPNQQQTINGLAASSPTTMQDTRTPIAFGDGFDDESPIEAPYTFD